MATELRQLMYVCDVTKVSTHGYRAEQALLPLPCYRAEHTWLQISDSLHISRLLPL